jgi:solute carrier family 13 (sodium-dependent dicarboxylate transporter), member 2/3/5
MIEGRKYQRLFMWLGPAMAIFVFCLPTPAGMSQEAHGVLACMMWLVIWWLSEAVPIAMTSLLPLILFPLMSILPVKNVSDYYANPIIFLFIGGFIIALAMEKWNLHKRIALNIIHVAGTNQRQILLGFIIATGGLSMWISNTATTMMMLPIALSIISQFIAILKLTQDEDQSIDGFGKALIMSIAFAASIGGMATIVGTPTNLILVEGVKQLYDYEISFQQWFLFGLPLVIALLIALWVHFSFVAFRLGTTEVIGAKEIIQKEIKSLGPMSHEEKWVSIVFGLVALAWIFRQPILEPLIPNINDTTIALIGAVSLFLIPSKMNTGNFLMDWNQAKQLPWAVILLFGGAFALAGSFSSSGLTEWVGGKLTVLASLPFWLILLAVVALVNSLTELTQNMATCTLMIPVLAALSLAIDVHPLGLMTAMTIAASCAFMMPVATAPNAIIFGSGKLEMRDMVRAGFLLNIISIFLITLFTYFLMPYIWDIDLSAFPDSYKSQ